MVADRIPIKLQLTGKSRSVFKLSEAAAYAVELAAVTVPW